MAPAAKKGSTSRGRRRRGAVLITGISGTLGRLLTRRLHREHEVIGVDRRPFEGRPKDVRMHRIDIRRKKCEDIFRAGGIRAVVHLNLMHNPRDYGAEQYDFNIIGTNRILQYCHRYRVPKVVVLSSANIYGPRPDNSTFLTEEAPILGGQKDPALRSLIEVDITALSFSWQHPEVQTVILRPVHIVGSVHNAPSLYFRMPYVPKLLGFDPMVQLIHEEDVVEAVVAALQPGIRGVFNVVGPGTVPLSAVIRELEKPSIPVPHVVSKPLLDLMFRWKLLDFRPADVDHLRYSCTVDGSRAREVLGFLPRRTMQETIDALRDGL